MVPGVVHDGVKSMSNCKDSTSLKLGAYSRLDQVVCLQIHSCCGLI